MKTIHSAKYESMIAYLREARLRLGLTQEAVAARLGVHRTWVNKIEQRERRLDFLETLDLCRLYKIDPAALARIIEERP